MTPRGVDWFYLHGFASSPHSTKGKTFGAWAERHGVALDRLDLRVPSFEDLRLSAIVARVREAIDGLSPDPARRAVLIGSSLGGLAALRVAEADPRVAAVFVMAPAMGLTERWRERLGPKLAAWKATGFMDVPDHALGGTSRIGYGFFEELEAMEQRAPWPDVRVPTFVVHGVADDVVDIAYSRRWAKGRRNVVLLEVPDGHDHTASMPQILARADHFFAPFLRENSQLAP